MTAHNDFNHFGAVIRTVSKGSGNLAKDNADFMRDAAKVHAPVDTGLLKISIHTEVAGHDHYQVIADTQAANRTARAYAHYVEYGTRHMAAQPYMHPAYVEGISTLLPRAIVTFGSDIDIAAETGRSI